MSKVIKRKEHLLSLRLSQVEFVMIDRAAHLLGRSRADFVHDAVVRAAEDVLMEAAPIQMSPAGFKAFAAALSAQAVPVPEMVEVVQRNAPWEQS